MAGALRTVKLTDTRVAFFDKIDVSSTSSTRKNIFLRNGFCRSVFIKKKLGRGECNHNEMKWVLYKFINSVKTT